MIMAWNTPIPNVIRSAMNSLMQRSASVAKRAVQYQSGSVSLSIVHIVLDRFPSLTKMDPIYSIVLTSLKFFEIHDFKTLLAKFSFGC